MSCPYVLALGLLWVVLSVDKEYNSAHTLVDVSSYYRYC